MNSPTAVSDEMTFASRWWTYQRERFPVFAHGLLIATFSFSAVSFSWLLRGGEEFPKAASFVVAFVTSFLFFLQLRIADEFKDIEEDSRHRPYRPVPRGLVSLSQLGILGAVCGIIQLVCAFTLLPPSLEPSQFLGVKLPFTPGLPGLLLIVWVYLALMSKEFFVRRWLKAHPFTYLWTHMLIIPLVDLYATSCDWMPKRVSAPPEGLIWFLVASFFNGIVLEIGRKIRIPDDEEEGVETYTALWGQRIAVFAWLAALSLTAFCAWLAAGKIYFQFPVLISSLLVAGSAGMVARRFLKNPSRKNARFFEHFSGIWTLTLYLSLGPVPLLIRILSS